MRYYEFQAINENFIVLLSGGMFASSYEEAMNAAYEWWRRNHVPGCTLRVLAS